MVFTDAYHRLEQSQGSSQAGQLGTPPEVVFTDAYHRLEHSQGSSQAGQLDIPPEVVFTDALLRIITVSLMNMF